jgi:hypothetical protein
VPVNTEAGLTIRGEVLVVAVGPAVGDGDARAMALPALPGPGLLLAFHDADVGAGLIMARPARVGLRPVLWVTAAVVGDHDKRARLQGGYGLSTEVGRVSWVADGRERRVVWPDRSLTMTARSSRRVAVPVAMRVHLAQPRAGGPVLLPVWLAGLVRPASATVEAEGGEPARHRGVLLSGVHLAIRPARTRGRGRRLRVITTNGITAEPAARRRI